jgi:hypothetical protein
MGPFRNMRSAYRLTGLRLVACRLRNDCALPTDLRLKRPAFEMRAQKRPGQSATTLECWLFW